MTNEELQQKVRSICTYHSELEEGTSGYNLSEEQFAKLFNLIDQQIAEETKVLREDNQRKAEYNRRIRDEKRNKINTKLIKALKIDPQERYVLLFAEGSGLHPQDVAEINFPNVEFSVMVKDINSFSIKEKEEIKKML